MDEKVKAMVDEFLKNKDVEKLSKDDLDNISGGVTVPDDYVLAGNTRKQMGKFIQTILDTFGPDIAIEVANHFIQTEDWKNFLYMGENAGWLAVNTIYEKQYEAQITGKSVY